MPIKIQNSENKVVAVGNFLSGRVAKLACFFIVIPNIFLGASYALEIVLHYMELSGFSYDLGFEKLMPVRLVSAAALVYGSFRVFSKSSLGRNLVILSLVVLLITAYPFDIKAFESPEALPFLGKYLLLFNFLWIVINCLILPKIRIESA